MPIKTIIVGAAFAMVAATSAASTAEQFATVEGIAAQPMTTIEMANVSGSGADVFLQLFDSADAMKIENFINGSGPIIRVLTQQGSGVFFINVDNIMFSGLVACCPGHFPTPPFIAP